MSARSDRVVPVVIFAVLLVLSAFAVVSQMDLHAMPKAARDRPPIGSKFDDFTLKDISGDDRSLAEFVKDKKATVLYFWSIGCPCVDALEMRLQKTIHKYEALGVQFVAIDSEPDDDRNGVFEKMARIHATAYTMLLDPKQDVLKRSGVTASTELVVLDAQAVIRYRGSFDDDLIKPKVEFLPAVLDALLEGRTPIPAETAPYGCPFTGFEGVCASAPDAEKKP
jgi:peroxiredoxin